MGMDCYGRCLAHLSLGSYAKVDVSRVAKCLGLVWFGIHNRDEHDYVLFFRRIGWCLFLIWKYYSKT